MITVLIVDDHISVQKSLQYMLEAAGDIQVVATASSGEEAILQARTRCPDVAVVDISMPGMDGIEATRQIKAHCRQTRVMMLSMFDHAEYVQRALQVGALGFVLKEAIGQDLLAAIRAVSSGNCYFSQRIAGIASKYIDWKSKDGQAS